jgi:glutathione peroxidase
MITDRRHVLALLAGGIAAPASARAASMTASSSGAAMTPVTAYAFSFTGLNGGTIPLSDYAGKPIIVVNTASLCDYTPQYSRLEQLFQRFHDRGLVMIGVPSNDFGGQEPGGPGEIAQTANKEYGVTFPLTAKADVIGRSTNGRRTNGRWKRRSGTSTNISSAATAISRRCSLRRSSRWTRASSTPSAKS